MSDVKWSAVENRISSITSVDVPAKNVMETLWNKDSYIVGAKAESGEIVDFDLSELFSPILGNFWRVLYKEEAHDDIRDAMIKYWKYKEIPTIKAKIAKFEDNTETVLGVRLTTEKEKKVKPFDPNDIISGVNETFPYNRVVVGSNNEHIELQFLNSSNRLEASPGDFIDPGLFVFMNGNVQISAGINRLVCTNGLTERLHVFESREFKFNDEILQRAVSLATWLIGKKNVKVCSVRELSVILNDYPKPMAAKFWREWAQKIEMKELTWYDVIADITNYANKYMDKTRQRILQFSETLKEYEHDATCPVCSTTIKEG